MQYQHYLKVSLKYSFVWLNIHIYYVILIVNLVFLDKFPVITSVTSQTSQSAYETIVVDDDKIPPPIPIDAMPSCSKYGIF